MTSKPHGKAPFTRHPLFPGIVALWFAVLIGMGGLAIGTATLESLVRVLQLDLLIPAAAPPLGFTARALVALAMALAGGGLGLSLARALARAGADRAPEDTDAGLSAPLPVADDNDDLARLDAARDNAPTRRRALTIEQATSAAAPSILTLADITITPATADGEPERAPAPAAAPTPAPSASVQPATAGMTNLPVRDLVERFGRALEARRTREDRLVALDPTDATPASFLTPARPEEVQEEAEGHSVLPAETVAAAHHDADLSEPANESLSGPADSLAGFAPLPAAERPTEPPRPSAALTEVSPAPEQALSDTPPADRPFDMPASLRAPGLGNVEWFDEAEEEASLESTLESLLPPKRPSASDPFRLAMTAAPAHATDEDEDNARWTLPDPEGEPLDEDTLEEGHEDAPILASNAPGIRRPGFSSLLNMKLPDRTAAEPIAPFVRVEDIGMAGEPALPEAVVVFPGQAQAPARLGGNPLGARGIDQTPAATEDALREALVTLQRMSKTG